MAAETGKPTHKSIIIAALLPAFLIFLFLPWGVGLIIIALALAALLFMAWLSRRQIGGVTGDVLGAIQQTSEIIILLGLLSCGRMLT
ncbi:MAG: adenosylcobinamide-GDP ribazoletransferase [Emcibacter sp.]|nr:adenosylcobinamide-GDP ribazoletransferase [Emcibacter sp.]